MTYAVILAAGVGQRMRNGGLPKQFLKLMGKPIIVHTLEKFEHCKSIDSIVIVCHSGYVDDMKSYVNEYHIKKVKEVAVGGRDRQDSLRRGLSSVISLGAKDEDVVMIHDGVRPLISENTITENIRCAKKYGNAITVRAVTETAVVTSGTDASLSDFKKRDDTYSLTSPQTFKLGNLRSAYGMTDKDMDKSGAYASDNEVPLLDAGMVYAKNVGSVHLVKENNVNIKITTPEDYYFLKAIMELEENKYVFGL